MQSEQYHLFETAIGVCGVAWSERGLTRLQLPEADRRATERRLRARSEAMCAADVPADIARAVAEVQAYAAGAQTDFADIDLDLAVVPVFHAQVYEAACRIGWGQTTTYGALAREIGAPGAARAVGQALGRNPIPVIVPCHRILAAGGKSGGFSAYGGVASKARLLALEGVRLDLGEKPESTQQAFAFEPVAQGRGR